MSYPDNKIFLNNFNTYIRFDTGYDAEHLNELFDYRFIKDCRYWIDNVIKINKTQPICIRLIEKDKGMYQWSKVCDAKQYVYFNSNKQFIGEL